MYESGKKKHPHLGDIRQCMKGVRTTDERTLIKKCRHVADSARCLYVTFLFSASALGFVCAVVLFAPLLGLPSHSAAARALLPVILLPGVLISLRPLPESFPRTAEPTAADARIPMRDGKNPDAACGSDESS